MPTPPPASGQLEKFANNKKSLFSTWAEEAVELAKRLKG
jgi:hypothetical protein